MNLAWVVVVGVVGHRRLRRDVRPGGRAWPAARSFDLSGAARPPVGLANLLASFFINFLTLTAELGGGRDRALAGVERELPAARSPSSPSSSGSSSGGCRSSRWSGSSASSGSALLVFVVTVWQHRTDWGAPDPQASHPQVPGDGDGLHLRLLRHRAVRRGDDALRGVLLLERRRRGALDREGPRPRTGPTSSSASRSAASCRWPSWRRRDPRPRTGRHRRRTALARSSLPGRVVLGPRRPGRRRSWASSPRRSAPPSRPRSPPATRRAVLRMAVGKYVRPRQAARFHLVVLLSIGAANDLSA